MAYTGPVETPLAFNTIYEVDDLIKFLTKTQMDLDTRFDVISGMIKGVEVDERGHLRFDNIRKMLENVVTLCEDIALSMGLFSHALVKKKLIKRNTSLPQITLRRDKDPKKMSANWSYASEMSLMNSENRLSVFEEEGSKAAAQMKVSFNLISPSQSSDALQQQVETDVISFPEDRNGTSLPSNETSLPSNETSLPSNETSLPVNEKSLQCNETSLLVDKKSSSIDRNSNPLSADKNEFTPHEDSNGNMLSNGLDHMSAKVEKESSKVYVHLIPTDPSINLSVLREKLLKFSNSMIPENIKLELVTSDIIIGLSPRHLSSSSDNQSSFVKSGFRTSDEPLSVRAINNLSRFAVENSETSDDDNRSIRLISSSDSETSIKRFHLKPVIVKKSVETQTEGLTRTDG
ncbi:uncharacterized protein LOC132756545 isoform X2 [Ruditapes philippinarum]|uniref:uncharacterized protein LOC132756545 isoform X2 n=1 Tax=Ruditapes philippinarum TaxID=129788 RepID=UPI00295AB394|nr:uncharacterized protein LOC132756545 isoform X2 [Ruditapes philippinarum]